MSSLGFFLEKSQLTFAQDYPKNRPTTGYNANSVQYPYIKVANNCIYDILLQYWNRTTACVK